MLQQNNNNNHRCLGMPPPPSQLLQSCPGTGGPLPRHLELGGLPLIRGLRAWALSTAYAKAKRWAGSSSVQSQPGPVSSAQIPDALSPSDLRTPRVRPGGLGALVTVATLKASDGGRQTQTHCLFLRAEGGSYLCAVGPQTRHAGGENWLGEAVEGGQGCSRAKRGGQERTDEVFKVKPRSVRKWRKSNSSSGKREGPGSSLAHAHKGKGSPQSVAEGLASCGHRGHSARPGPTAESNQPGWGGIATEPPLSPEQCSAPQSSDPTTCSPHSKATGTCTVTDLQAETGLFCRPKAGCDHNPLHEGRSCDHDPLQEERNCDQDPPQEERSCDHDPPQEERSCDHDPPQEERSCDHNPPQEERSCDHDPLQEERSCDLNPQQGDRTPSAFENKGKVTEVREPFINLETNQNLDDLQESKDSNLSIAVSPTITGSHDQETQELVCEGQEGIDDLAFSTIEKAAGGEMPRGSEGTVRLEEEEDIRGPVWPSLIGERGSGEDLSSMVDQPNQSPSQGPQSPIIPRGTTATNAQTNLAPTATMATPTPVLKREHEGKGGGAPTEVLLSLTRESVGGQDRGKVAAAGGSVETKEEEEEEEEEDEFGVFMQAGEPQLWTEGFSEKKDSKSITNSLGGGCGPAAWTSDWSTAPLSCSENSWTAFNQGDDKLGHQLEGTPGGQWWPSATADSTDVRLLLIPKVEQSVFLQAFPAVQPSYVHSDDVPTLKELLQCSTVENMALDHRERSFLDGLQDLDRMIGVKYKGAESLSQNLLAKSLQLEYFNSEQVTTTKPANARLSPSLPSTNQLPTYAPKRRWSYDINRNIMA